MNDIMKKILFALSLLFVLTGCMGGQTVEKVDEKGCNPAPEQIIDMNGPVQEAETAVEEAVDSLAI